MVLENEGIDVSEAIVQFDNGNVQQAVEILSDNKLGEINKKFNEDLEKFKDKKSKAYEVFNIGLPGNILKEVGIPDKKIVLKQGTLTKKIDAHDFTVNDIKNLPIYINNPAMVFRGVGVWVPVINI